jgi:hypothetical protein
MAPGALVLKDYRVTECIQKENPTIAQPIFNYNSSPKGSFNPSRFWSSLW